MWKDVSQLLPKPTNNGRCDEAAMKRSAQPSRPGDCAGSDDSGSITAIAMGLPSPKLVRFARHCTNARSAIEDGDNDGNAWILRRKSDLRKPGNAVTAETNGRKRMFLLPGARSSLNVREPPSGETDVSYVSPRQKSIPIRHESVEIS